MSAPHTRKTAIATEHTHVLMLTQFASPMPHIAPQSLMAL